MSFEFDPTADGDPSVSEFNKFQTQESADDRRLNKSVVKVDYSNCEQTGVCAEVCPEDVFKFTDGHLVIVKAQDCTECWICVENCVSSAIEIG